MDILEPAMAAWQHTLTAQMRDCRQRTLDLVATLDRETLCRQAHSEFSPVGWHVGHIGFTEELWWLRHHAGAAPIAPQYHRLLAADGLPKHQRGDLPDLAELLAYLSLVRSRVLERLASPLTEEALRLGFWLVQHECQHVETMLAVLETMRSRPPFEAAAARAIAAPPSPDMVEIPAGWCILGSNAIAAMDNERPPHRQWLDAYAIDRYPVTNAQFAAFLVAGGYDDPQWWTSAGWAWRQQHPDLHHPLYWHPHAPDCPVSGVSWFEADAYARFAGKRLPTEAEWEKAASWHPDRAQPQSYPWGDAVAAFPCNIGGGGTTPVRAFPAGQSPSGCWDMLGNVWEWTASTFCPYPGFAPFPYPGYSSAYFDRAHYVLKGGSWASQPPTLRASFRNWYLPHVRQLPMGFRCARSAAG